MLRQLYALVESFDEHGSNSSCVFPQNFCLQLVLFPLGKCRKSGDHPKEHLVESGYKPNMKFGSLIIPLYFSYTLKTKVKKSGKFYYLFAHFQPLKTSKIT